MTTTTALPRSRLLADLATFAREHVRSRDIDPVYPVLRALYASPAVPTAEQQHWFTALYLAFYHLGAAAAAFAAFPEPAPLPRAFCAALPCATERRGLRGGKAADFLASYGTLTASGVGRFLAPALLPGAAPEDTYERVWLLAQAPAYNGRWAAFKWCELLRSVHGLPLAAPDMRLEFCSGPLAGLARVTGVDPHAPLSVLNQAADALAQDLAEVGLPLAWEELETVLCDFHSLAEGHYYLGHDIDQMQEQLRLPALPEPWRERLFAARWQSLPHGYLGERHGWAGIDRARRTLYRDRGLLLPGSVAYRRATRAGAGG